MEGRSRYRVLPVHEGIEVMSDLPLSSSDLEDELCAHLVNEEQGILPWDLNTLSEYPSYDWHL